MKRFVVAVLFLALLLLPTAGVFAEEPEYGGTFRHGMTTNPRGMFNTILSTEVYDGYINDLVYDALVEINAELEPVPQLAKSWEISDDNLSVTFFLKEGVTFHDGVELTAEDVEFTYKTILHPHYTGVRYGTFAVLKGAEAYHTEEVDYVEGIEVIDDYTIRFTTERPHAPLLNNLTYGILPKHILGDVPVAEMEAHDFNANPIGTGPFKFVEFRTDQHVILDRFEEYHGVGPYLDRVVFQVLSEDAVPVYLRQGRVDYAGVSSEQYPMVVDLEFIETFVYEALSYSYIAFNLRQERFEDQQVRQALKHAFDRQTYVDVILDGFGIVANAPMPQASWAFTEEGINEYPYDPDLAQEMLADAGWAPGADGVLEKDGMRMEFELLIAEGTRATEQMALLFQQNMGDIGIKVDVRPMEFSAAVDRIDAREFDMFNLGWSLGSDPDPSGIWLSDSPWNDPGWINERSDELINKGRSTLDMEERAEIYAEWQRLINADLPYIFLNYSVSIAAINERIKGIDRDPGPYGPIVARGILNEVWIPADKQ